MIPSASIKSETILIILARSDCLMPFLFNDRGSQPARLLLRYIYKEARSQSAARSTLLRPSHCPVCRNEQRWKPHSQRSVEQENLEKKKNIIEKLNAIDDQMDTEGATQLVRDLMKEWNGVGHVPFKEKDRIYKQYHSQIDKLFERFNIGASNKKLSNFKSTISSIQEGSPQALYREREKLVRAFDNMKNELQTYENNLGFLTTSSKKGNSLLTEINRKVEKLKADIELVKEKIKVVDENIKNQG